MTVNPHPLTRRGLMLVISSPSGAGKTTISHKLLEKDFGLQRSISVTNRPPRSHERDGIDYFFVSPERFEELVQQGELLEHTENHGKRYGTPRTAVEEALSAGQDLLFVIDVRGAAFMRQRVRQDVVSIFVLPPSIAEQKHRLELRNEDDAATVQRRLITTQDELPYAKDYDYIVVNDDLDRATEQIEAIIRAERQRTHRFTNLTGLVEMMQGELRRL